MPIQGMGSVQEQSTPEQGSTLVTFRRRMVLLGFRRFASLRSASRRFAAFAPVSLGFALLRRSRRVLVSFRFVSFPRPRVSARSRLESLQVQQSVGWNLTGLGGGRFQNFLFFEFPARNASNLISTNQKVVDRNSLP